MLGCLLPLIRVQGSKVQGLDLIPVLFRLDSLLEHAELSRRGARRLEKRLNASSHRPRMACGARTVDAGPGGAPHPGRTHNSHRPRRASLAPRRESYAITRRSKKYLSTQRTHAHVHTTHDDDAHTHGICHTGHGARPGSSRHLRRARRGKSATLSASFSANSAARAPQPAPQSMYTILSFANDGSCGSGSILNCAEREYIT